MGYENADKWEDLNPDWPLGSDGRNFGDDHLRQLKRVAIDLGQRLAAIQAGTIFYHAGGTAPEGALTCDGQEVAQADYPELYAVIQDRWATTDGAAAPGAGNFRLPPRIVNGRAAFPYPATSANVGTAYGPLVGQHNHTMNHNHALAADAAKSAGTHRHSVKVFDGVDLSPNPLVEARFDIELSTDQDGAGSHKYADSPAGTPWSGFVGSASYLQDSGAHTHDVDIPNYSGNTGSTGTADDNRPPSIGLLMCIWTGKVG